MKKCINLLFCIAFILCLVLPTVNMELRPNVQSGIDNAYLPEFSLNPADLSNYVDKRIGFRAEALSLYQTLNDKLFNIVVHPMYLRGENGHIFYKLTKYVAGYQNLNLDQEGAEEFADSLLGFQRYVEQQGKTFMYFLIPDKKTVYSEYFPKSVNVYGDISLVDQVITALEDRHVNYFYAEDVMVQEKQFRDVNNVLYDAGHWNNHGAFISIQALYNLLQKDYPQLKTLERTDFIIKDVLEESLLTSHFEINEIVPYYVLANKTAIDESAAFKKSLTLKYPNYVVHHTNNPACPEAPKILVLGDSYLASESQFFMNNFSEYTFINRDNVTTQQEFEYYVDVTDPDIVIFENPERTLLFDID